LPNEYKALSSNPKPPKKKKVIQKNWILNIKKLTVRGCRTVIPASGRLRQEDLKFSASLGYIVRPCLTIRK
jgi:hypothetical protein